MPGLSKISGMARYLKAKTAHFNGLFAPKTWRIHSIWLGFQHIIKIGGNISHYWQSQVPIYLISDTKSFSPVVLDFKAADKPCR